MDAATADVADAVKPDGPFHGLSTALAEQDHQVATAAAAALAQAG